MTVRIRSDQAWTYFLGAGLAVVALYNLVPTGLPRDGVYAVVGLAGVSAIVYGIVANRPVQRSPWVVMAIGQLIWVLGDFCSSYNADIAHSDAYPSIADGFYLAAYPLLAFGLFLLIRGRRPRRDVAGVLDSATVTAGLGLLSWTLLAQPTIDASHYSLAAAIVGVSYPIADIVLLGGVIRLIVTPGGRTLSFRLLLGAVLLLVAGDSLSSGLSLYSSSGGTSYIDGIWLASYVLWGASALHPSMRTLSEPVLTSNVSFTFRRLLALGIATLVAPGTLAVQRLGGFGVDVWAVVVGSFVLFALVVARMGVAIRQILAANVLREKLQADLAYQAAHDSLTGLPNRAQTMDLIEGALRRAQRSGAMIGLLFVDLDGFKSVNDTFGHAAGDRVLQTTAQRMLSCVRGGDVVARLGGDEFVVLLEPIDNEREALDVANRVVGVASQPISLGESREANIGASVGIAISLDGAIDPEALLHEADTAVYRAKISGRGRAEIFGEHVRVELAERSALERAIASAIHDDELLLHFQPIMDLQVGAVRGYEALVRWQRPNGEMVPPAQFIPAAERSNLICELDVWVLNHALAQLRHWQDADDSQLLTMAVNITARHLSSRRILTDVQAALDSNGIAAEQLTLEITESGFRDDPVAFYHLDELRRLGVSISMDDFGTGYNSILRLKQLPIDTLKIDRSLLDPDNATSEGLLRLMLQAARTFGLPVVAEGVEDDQQLEFLKSMNCESGQGFFFGRPGLAADVWPYRAPISADVKTAID